MDNKDSPDDKSSLQKVKTEKQSLNLKIAQVYSEAKIQNHQPLSTNSIRVKTPGQLNGNIRRVVPQPPLVPKQVTVKRLGSTIIRGPTGASTMTGTKVGEALKAQMVRLSNGSFKLVHTPPNAKNPVTIRPMLAAHKSSPKDEAKPAQAVFGDKHSYCKRLEIVNLNMRKALMECKREAASARKKIEQLAIVVDNVLAKLANVNIPNEFHLSEPTANVPTSTRTPMVGTPSKQTSRSYQLPIFPMRLVSTLKRFENSLSSAGYFQYTYQRLMIANSKVKIDKPASMLSYILQSLIKIDLLGEFVWDTDSPVPPNTEPLVFTHFVNFKTFLIRLANGLSNVLYGRNLDMRAIVQFLRVKIQSQGKIRQNQLLKGQSSSFNQQPNTSKPVAFVKATEFLACPEEMQNGSSSGSDDQSQLKEIQWIDEELATAEQKEMEIGSNAGVQNEDSNDVGSDSDSNEHNLESILDEHDFEFLDC